MVLLQFRGVTQSSPVASASGATCPACLGSLLGASLRRRSVPVLVFSPPRAGSASSVPVRFAAVRRLPIPRSRDPAWRGTSLLRQHGDQGGNWSEHRVEGSHLMSARSWLRYSFHRRRTDYPTPCRPRRASRRPSRRARHVRSQLDDPGAHRGGSSSCVPGMARGGRRQPICARLCERGESWGIFGRGTTAFTGGAASRRTV